VTTREQHDLLVLCALRHDELGRIDWQLLARTAQTDEGLARWFRGEVPERSAKATKARPVIEWALTDQAAMKRGHEFVDRQLEAAYAADAKLITVLDDDYPANLRLVPDAPPFLFYRGTLEPADARSIAVVGTRNATADGLSRAARMARGLAHAGIVVVSGLAKGIDTAAHTAAVEVSHRTVAVTGTGIAAPVYPRENASLATQIIEHRGAVISQFWPTDPPDRWRFPARNITMSGFTQGTVVIEASSTSGAKMQAQAARRHARTVFLLRSLAAAQPWAQRMLVAARSQAHRPEQPDLLHDHEGETALPSAVIEVSDVSDITSQVADPDAVHAAAEQRHQLAHALPNAL
jgi:DNA processing protein